MTKARMIMPDFLRFFALFGIVVVNAQYFAFPSDYGYVFWQEVSAVDRVTIIAADAFLTMKTYGLFSFMFGVGIAFQLASAERSGANFKARYFRRMIGLAIFGILHGIFFFYGDILLIYAVFGAIAYFFRNFEVRTLIRLGGVLLLVQSIFIGGMVLIPFDIDQNAVDLEITTFSQGGFWDVAMFRGELFALFFIIQVFIQGISALGWFALGLAAVKSKLLADPDHQIWKTLRGWPLLVGVALSVFGAAMMHIWGQNWGQALMLFIAPVSTLGYLGVIAKLSRAPSHLMVPFLKAGQSSLTVYLGTSIIMSFIYCGYGLGLFNQLSPFSALISGLLVTAAMMVVVLLWQRVFQLAPFEWVLRKITYGGKIA